MVTKKSIQLLLYEDSAPVQKFLNKVNEVYGYIPDEAYELLVNIKKHFRTFPKEGSLRQFIASHRSRFPYGVFYKTTNKTDQDITPFVERLKCEKAKQDIFFQWTEEKQRWKTHINSTSAPFTLSPEFVESIMTMFSDRPEIVFYLKQNDVLTLGTLLSDTIIKYDANMLLADVAIAGDNAYSTMSKRAEQAKAENDLYHQFTTFAKSLTSGTRSTPNH